MAEPQLIRTVKLRSKENQVYSPRYNRANFEVPSDPYSTDLSQSYLDLTFKVISVQYGQPISTETLAQLSANDIEVSFGHQDFDYSAACLIRECVLKRGSDGSILESIPFSNILSQTLHQLTSNKEMETSNSLLSGSVVNQGQKSNVFSNRSTIVTNPVNIHIPLSDLFQIARSQNFWLSSTKGLILELLFEDKLSLLKIDNVASKQEIILDTTGDTSYANEFKNYTSSAVKSSPMPDFPTTVAGDVETATVADKGRLYRADQYFEQPGFSAAEMAGTTTPNSAVILKDGNLTVAEISSIGFKKGDNVRMTFSLGEKRTGLPKYFEMMNTVSNVLPYTPATGPQPGVTSYTINPASIVEWTGANSGDYLKGGAAAGDMTSSIFVNINPDGGGYSLNVTDPASFMTFVDKAYAVNVEYIIPAHYLLGATGIAPTDAMNLSIKFVSAVAEGTAPQVADITATGGYQQNIPELPGLAEIKAQLVMSDAWYSQSNPLPRLVSIEVCSAVQLSFLDGPGGDVTGTETYAVLDGTNAPGQEPYFLEITETMADSLVNTGLLEKIAAGSYKVNPSATFEAGIQIAYPQTGDMAGRIAAKTITQIAPEHITETGTYSNGYVCLPNSGRGVKLLEIRKVGDKYLLKFTPLDLTVDDRGFKFRSVVRASVDAPWLPNYAAKPTGFKFIFSRYNAPKAPITDATVIGQLSKGLTYNIDKLELVLVQASKNKKMPMAMAYPSYRIEAFTIQTPLKTFDRQFNVIEPNVFNTCIMSPRVGSLVSTGREINRYRWSVNNISNTSKDIVIRTPITDYPTGLHLDKMLDYFNNSSAPLKNFFGLKGLENVANPVVMFPLKVYTSSDQSQMFENSSAFTAQITMESEKTIEQGTMLFVKSVIKMI